jgi:myo-inositol-1-phosphate synthase
MKIKIENDNVKYTEDEIISKYVYETVKTSSEDGVIKAKVHKTNYTFKTKIKTPKLGYFYN